MILLWYVEYLCGILVIVFRKSYFFNNINNIMNGGNFMSVIKVSNENFNSEVISSDKPVLIDFYADWCGPCKMLSPVVDKLAEEHSEFKVVKVNVDENPDLAGSYQVMSIPTLVVIENGKEVNRSMGLQSKQDILNLVSR